MKMETTVTQSMNRFAVWSVPFLAFFLQAACAAFSLAGEFANNYSDFAIHSRTGTIAAICAEKDEVHYFRASEFDKGMPVPFAKTAVGPSPSHIAYKRYRDKHWYVVVCSNSNQLHLIDASIENGPVIPVAHSVPLRNSRNSYVATSPNGEDPFLFCSSGSNDSNTTEVIDVRDFSNQGALPTKSLECRVSNTGKYLYLRDNSNTIHAMLRTSNVDSVKQAFKYLRNIRPDQEAWCTDPSEQKLIVGKRAYSADLSDDGAELEFAPELCLRSAPFLMGVTTNAPSPSPDPIAAKQEGGAPAQVHRSVVVQAASAHTLKRVGKSIPVDYDLPAGNPSHQKNDPSPTGDYRPLKRMRLLADESRRRLLLLEGNHVHVIPWSEMELPDTPWLFAKVVGSAEFMVGVPGSLTLQPVDKRCTIELDDLIPGMQYREQTLRWEPKEDQVGPTTVVAKVKWNDMESKQSIQLNAIYPHIRLPFAAHGACFDEDSTEAIVWDRPEAGVPLASQRNIAKVDTKSGNTLASRSLGYYVGTAAMTNDWIILVPAREGVSTLDLYRRDDLSFGGQRRLPAAIQTIEVMNGDLYVQANQTVHVFDGKSMNRKDPYPETIINYDQKVGKRFSSLGFFAGGFFMNYRGERQLLAITAPLYSVEQGAPDANSGLFIDQDEDFSSTLSGFSRSWSNRPKSKQKAISSSKDPLQIEVAFSDRQESGKPFGTRKIFITPPNSPKPKLIAEQPLAWKDTTSQTPGLGITLGKDRVWFFVDQKMFSQTLLAVPNPKVFSFVPKQSAFFVSNLPKTELEHSVQANKGPVKFSLSKTSLPMEIDASTGTVTIDREPLMNLAITRFTAQLLSDNKGVDPKTGLDNYESQTREYARHFLDRAPEGPIVSMPIEVVADEERGRQTKLGYHLLIELDREQVLAIMLKTKK